MKLRSAIAAVVLLIALLIISGCLLKNSGTSTSNDLTLKINAKSNVFAAGEGGLDSNGGGVAAPSVTFEPRAGLVLTFSNVAGRVSCCSGGEEFNDADGGTFAGGVTNVESAGGISGITHPNKTMFLVGVFGDNSTAKPLGPARLDGTDVKNSTPKLFQTFFIGKGERKQIEVPPTATRLYLGFADAYNFTGAPGSYDDNVGELVATFSIRPR
ncbi:MAG TPA: hypothetical protein VF397_12630 [Pyrinomonadaceae bacterium]